MTPFQPASRRTRGELAAKSANIRRRILDLAEAGRGDVKKLAGRPNDWRPRVGAWRVTFTYDQVARELVVLAVEPRGSAYRR